LVVKGLTFVQLYAVYEYAVVNAVQRGLVTMSGHGLSFNALRKGLQVLALEGELKSVVDSARRRSWENRCNLFERAFSVDAATFQDSIFPDDGTHFRHAQLRTLWSVFEIAGPEVPDPRFIGRINELVEHRNAIAHGRETAENIGRRFSDGDIAQRVDDTQELCLHIVNSFEDHCTEPLNLTR
jgi:hypothetical protein